ncbi:MAG: AI-2E family transporter [Coriobacteriales bacterium]|jgi:predicted PurR-regulated permease PerM|nr:AI-2E family transporter [Coriobacteriales bacterium]
MSNAKPTRLDRAKRLFYLVWAVIGILALIVAAFYAIGQVWTSISILIFSAFLVFIMRSPVAWLERHRVPRALGTLIAYLSTLLLIALILLIFIPILWEQIIGFVSLIPSYVNDASVFWTGVYNQYSYILEDSRVQDLATNAAHEISTWAAGFASQSAAGVVIVGTNVFSAFMVMAVSLVVGFWILKDLPRIKRELLLLIGPKREEDAHIIAATCSRALGGYLRGMLVNCSCTGLLAGIGYYFIGLPYPAVLGLLTGLMNFIPFVGPWIAGILVAVVGLFVSPLAAVLAIAITIAAQNVTDNLIAPRVMGTAVELHPSVVLIVLFAGGALGGILGMIAAVPVAAAIKSLFVHYFEKRTGRQLAESDGALFRGRATHEANPAADADGTAPAEETSKAEAEAEAGAAKKPAKAARAGAAEKPAKAAGKKLKGVLREKF